MHHQDYGVLNLGLVNVKHLDLSLNISSIGKLLCGIYNHLVLLDGLVHGPLYRATNSIVRSFKM